MKLPGKSLPYLPVNEYSYGMRSFLHHLVWLLKGVQVYALVGESGTGKSFRARLIAAKYGVNFIIDDGLLIKDEQIIAGKSAKKEKIYLTAIKTALFDQEAHRQEVVRALERENFKRILIIGTSEGMVTKISKRLGLPHPSKMIKIEDIATQKDIEIARKSRNTEGKHVIPVPALEIKRNYPHIFYDSVRVFLKTRRMLRNRNKYYEKAVVRPEFSKRGQIAISETAITQMVLHCVAEYDPDIDIDKLQIISEGLRYRLTMDVKVPIEKNLAGRTRDLQNYIIDNIDKFTGIQISEVNITIKEIKD